MGSSDILVLIIISLLLVILPAPGLYKMFQKAGIPAWKAWVPFLNTWEMVKVEGLRKHWFFWQFIPVAGWFITLWIFIEFVKLFNKFKLYQHALAAFVPFLYFPYIGYNEKDKYYGPEIVKKHKKTAAREWIDAAVFAIVAATLIRTFVFEAYTIPTGSMEKTLLVNDFLFVSKLSYGPRIPNTPLAVPFVHHTLPGMKVQSYTEAVKLPYTRWFASPVKRNDVVVFNFPAGDTLTVEYDSADPYYDVLRRAEDSVYQSLSAGITDSNVLRQHKITAASRARDYVWENFTVKTRPVDKRENYIKRCVGIAGDLIEIRNNVVYINGQAQPVPPHAQIHYLVTVTSQFLDPEVMKEEYNLDDFDWSATGRPFEYSMSLTEESKKKMAETGLAKAIVPDPQYLLQYSKPVYPYDSIHNWNRDSYGPVQIPAKGMTMALTMENVTIYERPIRVYEGNKLEIRNGKIFINDKETNQYTFKMNYYWMMGDNRQGSQDSRFWGFVPEDHIVGEAWLIWMSWEKGIRWNRMFRTIH